MTHTFTVTVSVSGEYTDYELQQYFNFLTEFDCSIDSENPFFSDDNLASLSVTNVEME